MIQRSSSAIPEILHHLKAGEVVAIPMDTLYALIARVSSSEAIAEIARLKGWTSPQPLALLTDRTIAEQFGTISDSCAALLARFPYPVTALVPARDTAPAVVTGARKSLMLVCPDEFVRELVAAADFAIAATTANLSADTLVKTFETARQFFEGKVPLMVDGGTCRYGQSGTLIDFTTEMPNILHYGPVAYDDLKSILPNVQLPSHLRK